MLRRCWVMIAGVLVGVSAQASAEPGPIPAGKYECQVSSEYKFRSCTVSDDGKLDVPAGGLVAIAGPVSKQDDGWIAIDGRLTEKRSFGCHNCREGCEDGSCPCKEVPLDVQKTCQAQPVYVLLKPAGKGKWSGALVYSHYDVERKTEVNVSSFIIRAKKK